MSAPTRAMAASDSMHFLFDSTIEGGTGTLVGAVVAAATVAFSPSQLIAVRADAILQYERTIIELRRELLRYQSMVAELLGTTTVFDSYTSPSAVVPMDRESVRVINSIVQANPPASATFKEFEEEEL